MEKLLIIQSEIKVKKSQRNDFGKYNYRSAEDILEALKPILLKNKCVVILSDKIEVHNGRNYVSSTAKLIGGNSSLEVVGIAREQAQLKGMTEAQVTGACSSYARKFALNGLFAIDDTKDDDVNNKGQYEEAIDLYKIRAMIAETNSSEEKLLNFYSLNSLSDIRDFELYSAILNVLEGKREKLKKDDVTALLTKEMSNQSVNIVSGEVSQHTEPSGEEAPAYMQDEIPTEEDLKGMQKTLQLDV